MTMSKNEIADKLLTALASLNIPGASLAIQYRRTSARPMDSTSTWKSSEGALRYARNTDEEPYVPYAGQIISVEGEKDIYVLVDDPTISKADGRNHFKLHKISTEDESDGKYLSKIIEDTAAKLIRFAEGIDVTGGKVTTPELQLKDSMSSEQFISGINGMGMLLRKASNGDWNLEIDNLIVRKVISVFKIIVQKITHQGGMVVRSAAGGKLTKVTDGGSYWKCEHDSTDDFEQGDQIICQAFTGTSTKRYWRLVTSAGTGYFNLSKTDCEAGSATPEAGDEVAVLGNRTNTDRQKAQIDCAVGSSAPYRDDYAGINSYSLVGKLITRTGELSGITDAVFGALSGSGLYATNVYLKGMFILRSGKSVESELNAANTTALTAKNTADAAQGTANTAKTSADKANALLTDIASDDKLTATEKQQAKKEWDAIASEKPLNNASAIKFGVSTTAYDTAYNALSTYVTPLFSSLSTTSDLVGATFRTKFKDYYDARTNLLNAISDKAKSLADAAQSKADAAQKSANDLGTRITTVETNFEIREGQISSKITEATTAATNAKKSETNASGSATTATQKASEASGSATAAAGSAVNAGNSATAAAKSATNAQTAASDAGKVLEEVTKKESSITQTAGQIATNVTEVTKKVTEANTAASNASQKATEAGNSASAASGSATNASNSASSAAGSASTASSKATAAGNSATAAAGSAGTASTKAGEAATSATNAGASATNAKKSADDAAAKLVTITEKESSINQTASGITLQVKEVQTKAVEAAGSASSAAGSATTAGQKASEASGSAGTASTKAGEASTAATNAKNSATSASGSATTASTKAGEAATSATNASNAEIVARAMSQGKMLYRDPTFLKGLNGISLYNNNNNGSVNLYREAISGCPSTSGYGIRIASSGNASPGSGGFTFQNITRANAIFVTRFIAKIPTGYNVGFATNSIGNGGVQRWLTSQSGTGDWTEYAFYVKCGKDGSFASTNFFYITNGGAVTWYLSYATVYDITDAEIDYIADAANKYTTKTEFSSKITQLSDSIELKVSKTDFNALGSRVSSAEASITAQAGQIQSKASQTSVDSLTGRMTTAESSITQNAKNIALKVTATEAGSIADGKVNALKGDLQATGIDIANRKVTVTADTFRVQDNYGNAIAVFKTDTTGKPVIIASNIDTKNLVVESGAKIGGFIVDSSNLRNKDNQECWVSIDYTNGSSRRVSSLGNNIPSTTGIDTAGYFSATGPSGNRALVLNASGSTSYEWDGGKVNHAIDAVGGCKWKINSGDHWSMPGFLGIIRFLCTYSGNTYRPSIQRIWGHGIPTVSISRFLIPECFVDVKMEMGSSFYSVTGQAVGPSPKEGIWDTTICIESLGTNGFVFSGWRNGVKFFPRQVDFYVFGTPVK